MRYRGRCAKSGTATVQKLDVDCTSEPDVHVANHMHKCLNMRYRQRHLRIPSSMGRLPGTVEHGTVARNFSLENTSVARRSVLNRGLAGKQFRGGGQNLKTGLYSFFHIKNAFLVLSSDLSDLYIFNGGIFPEVFSWVSTLSEGLSTNSPLGRF